MSPRNDLSKVVRTTDAGEFPAVILIDNCSACNLTCSMCDHKNIKNYRNIQIMERGLYDKIIDEIARERPDARVWNIFLETHFCARTCLIGFNTQKRAGVFEMLY